MDAGELITKAEHGMGFVCDDLRDLAGKASPVVELNARLLSESANRLRGQVAALRQAMEAQAAS